MNPAIIQPDRDTQISTEEEYQALLRALRWAEGFEILFVKASQSVQDRLIQRVQQDITDKVIKVIEFKESIADFYQVVSQLPDIDQVDILMIQGLEHSLYEYEKTLLNPDEKISYTWNSVPRLLGGLNLRRESFRDRFRICFVFLVPEFVVRYFIHRAPDFFDWRSGLLNFEAEKEEVLQETQDILRGEDYTRYLHWSPEERRERLFKIQGLIDEPHQSRAHQVQLLYEQGELLVADHNPLSAMRSYEQALKLDPADGMAWYGLGNVQFDLAEYRDAIASYGQATTYQPDLHQAWYNRGLALNAMNRLEEAVISFDRALAIKPDKHEAWNFRGIVLKRLGRYEEAIASYDRAVAINPEGYQAWNNRGIALSSLGHYGEAIASFDRALQCNPEYASAWYNSACAAALLGDAEQAVARLKQAIHLDSEKYQEMAKNDPDFNTIRSYGLLADL